MKISLIVTDGLRQIALTPQDKEEIRLLECLTDKEWQLSIKRGQFFICQGGYARFGTETPTSDSVILVMTPAIASPDGQRSEP